MGGGGVGSLGGGDQIHFIVTRQKSSDPSPTGDNVWSLIKTSVIKTAP